jgi:formate dehydrogenase alpha subunit
MIKLTINGQEIETKTGSTVMEAALEHGIDIPHLCYHPDLPISGGCRMCLVEVDERPFPVTSCSLLAEDGMDIRTQSEQLYDMRHDLIDLYVADHPLDCVTCDKAGSCDLQKYAYEYGVTRTSHQFDLSRTLYQDDNPFFIRDHQYCILCGKCVRVCNDVVGARAIEISGRGSESHIATPFDGPMITSDCVFCGSCVQVCPTAALLPVARLGKGREWELDRVQSVCGYCGVGCNVEFAMKDGEILYVEGTGDNPVNGEMLCTKGLYGWDFATSPDRLTSPMLRRDVAYDLGLTDEPWELPEESVLAVRHPKLDDTHVPVDWDTALDLVAEKLTDTVQAYGPDAIMGFCSARCTNEDNYLFQKFFRASIKTNNIDHCARL